MSQHHSRFFLCLQSLPQCFCVSELSLLSLIKTPVIGFRVDLSLDPKIFNLITSAKNLFPNRVIVIGTRSWNLDISFDEGYCLIHYTILPSFLSFFLLFNSLLPLVRSFYPFLHPFNSHLFLTICCCPVTQSCLTLCCPMDCSTLGFPVHYQLPELTQTHVH